MRFYDVRLPCHLPRPVENLPPHLRRLQSPVPRVDHAGQVIRRYKVVVDHLLTQNRRKSRGYRVEIGARENEQTTTLQRKRALFEVVHDLQLSARVSE